MRRLFGAGLVAMLVWSTAACGADDAAGECPPIALAFLGALSGPSVRSGEVKRHAAALAVDEYNLENPDCRVGLVSYDTQGNPGQAAALADQVVAEPHVVAVIGPVFSGETEAVMPVFDDAGLAIVTPSATNARLSEQGWETFHRFVSSDAAQGPALASWLVDENPSLSAAVIDDGSLYGVGLADIIAAELEDRGASVAVRGDIDPEQVDFSNLIQRIERAGVDVIVFGGVANSGAPFYLQVREAGLDMLFAGADGMLIGSFLDVAAGDPEVLITCPCIGFAITPEQIAFAEEYRRVFGEPVSNYAVEAYDATQMLLGLISDGVTTRAGILDALSEIEYEGLAKTVRFTDTGEVETPEVYLFDVVEGEFVPRVVIRDGDLIEIG